MTAVTFHVFDPDKPDQDAIQGGDERVSAALLLEVVAIPKRLHAPGLLMPLDPSLNADSSRAMLTRPLGAG